MFILGSRLSVLDLPRESQKIDDVVAHRNIFYSSYAALYHPWIEVFEPLSKMKTAIPPSGSIAEKIRSDNPFAKIIFVTSHTELAHIGYLYGAFRYVRKYALEEELREAVQSLKHEFDMQSEFLPLKTPFGEVIRAINSIRYFEVKGHQVTAFFDDNEERMSGTLNENEQRLKDVGFIRIHKSFLVNFRFIESVGKTAATLTDGSTLSLSRNRVAETKRKMMIFSKNLGTDFSERRVLQVKRKQKMTESLQAK